MKLTKWVGMRCQVRGAGRPQMVIKVAASLLVAWWVVSTEAVAHFAELTPMATPLPAERLEPGAPLLPPAAAQLPLTLGPQPATVLLAKNNNKANPRAGRKKHLSGEVRSAGGRTNLNFDEAAIDGNRRLPMGVAISKNNPDHAYDLIELRLRWHPEMIESTTNLETGQGR